MIPTPFATASYINLATFRKNGQPVNTPVWFASDGRDLYILSAGNAGKVKRLKNSSRAKVATCTYNGTLTGNWQDAQALLLPDKKDCTYAHLQLQKKYGWQMKAFDFFSWLGGRIDKRAYIRISLVS